MARDGDGDRSGRGTGRGSEGGEGGAMTGKKESADERKRRMGGKSKKGGKNG